jgi:hypothetical protein
MLNKTYKQQGETTMDKVEKLKMYNGITHIFKLWVGHKIFSVTFTKKNGEKRNLVGTFSPEMWKGKQTTNGVGLNWNPTERGFLVVFDYQNEGWRMVNMNTIERIKFEGKTYNFKSFQNTLKHFMLIGMLLKVDELQTDLQSKMVEQV